MLSLEMTRSPWLTLLAVGIIACLLVTCFLLPFRPQVTFQMPQMPFCGLTHNAPPASGSQPNEDSTTMAEFVKIAFSFVLGFTTAVLAEPVRRWLFRSAVSLKFDPRTGFGRQCICLSTTTSPNVMAKYIRVLVTCSSRIGVTAKACRPFLTKIERLEPEYTELHHDPIQLKWSYIGERALDINPRMAFYFDVLEVNNRDDVLRPQTVVAPTTWAKLFSTPGRYRFSLTLSGENIAPVTDVQSPIEFEWKGSFDALTEDCFLE